MTDQAFLEALEACTLPEAAFTHAAHVRAAYLSLVRSDFPSALARVCSAIRRYAAWLGKPDRYHETVTVAYVSLIHQHLARRGDGGGWEGFARDNPELFQPGLLDRFYAPGQLDSPLARRVFVLPQARTP